MSHTRYQILKNNYNINTKIGKNYKYQLIALEMGTKQLLLDFCNEAHTL
jgi:hypothetical protein